MDNETVELAIQQSIQQHRLTTITEEQRFVKCVCFKSKRDIL